MKTNHPRLVFKLVLAVIIMLGVIVVWGSLVPGPVSRPINNVAKSAYNLRMIGQAIAQYAKTYHGEYPDSFQTLFLHEDLDSGQFINPASNDTPATGPTTQAIADQLVAGGHLSYLYVGRGLNAASVKQNTVIAYEVLQTPGDGGNVLFPDADVEYFDHVRFTAITARLTTRRTVGSGLSP
jgi:hypothetical protein